MKCRILLAISVVTLISLLSIHAGAEELTYEHYRNQVVAPGTSYTDLFDISAAPANAVLTNIEVQFEYIAYNGYEDYLSARINKGADPGSSGGAQIVAAGSLPDSSSVYPTGTTGTFPYPNYQSFSNWNGQSANGSYYIRFETGSGCPSPGTTIVRIRVRLTYSVVYPDFSTVNSYMSSNSDPDQELTDPSVGDVVYFRFTFNVANTAISSPFSVKCYLDGGLFYSTTYSSMPLGQHTTTLAGNDSWTVTAGSHTIRWEVDADGQITETSESNNTHTRVYSVADLPDLVHGDVTLRDSGGNAANGYIGETVFFRFEYSISGSGTTAPFDIRCELDGQYFWTESNVTGSGGQSYILTLSSGYAVTAGSHTVRFILDYNGEVTESNESNNESTTGWTPQQAPNPQVSVAPSSGPVGTTFSQPGTGFTPNGTATLHFDGPDGPATVTGKTILADGSYSHSWTCETCTPGTYSYYAVDDATQLLSNTVNFEVTSQNTAYLVPLYRGYSSTATDHFYTTDPDERDGMPSNGYTYEKIEAYISNRDFVGGVTLYRLYNATMASHYYTTNDADPLFSDPDWTDQGAAGYVYLDHSDYLVPMYHLYSATADDHFYTISEFERSNAIESFGYQDMGVAFYAARNSSAAPLAGKPVARRGGTDLSSGNFVPYRNHVDFANPAGFGLPFVFARTYNSGNSGEAGPLGPGWTHSYQIRVLDLGEIAIVKWGNGRDDLYTFDGTEYTPLPGIYNQLVKGYGSYSVTTKDSTVYSFASSPSGPPENGHFLGKLVEIRDRNGIELELVHDDVKEGLLDHVEDGSNRTYRFHYTQIAGDPSHLISEANRYRLTSIIEENAGSLSRSISFGYDTMGRLISYTDAEGNVTTYAYEDTDNPGLLTKITLPEGNTITAAYDGDKLDTLQIGSAGDVEKSIDLTYNATIDTPGGPVQGTVYTVQPGDGPGQTLSVTHDQYKLGIVKDGLGNLSEVLQYDANLNPTQILDKNGRAWSYSWGSSTGNLTGVVNPENEVTNYTYDPDHPNNLIRITDPANNITEFEYDANDNVARIIKYVGGIHRETTIGRYANGQIQTITTPPNNLAGTSPTTTYSYDAYGYLQTITDHAGHSATFDFDEGGRLLSKTDADLVDIDYTYNQLNQVLTATDMLNRVTTYAYDGNGNLERVTDPRNIVTQYSYTDRDLVETVTKAGVRVAAYGYDASGRRTTVTNARHQTWENRFDQAGNLTSITTPLGMTDHFHAYNPDGSLQRQVDRANRETTYTYDGAGRMTARSVTGGYQYQYAYWPNSLLRTVTRDGSVIDSYQYDERGNLTAFTDAFGQTVSYTYHPGGNLHTITYPGNRTVTYNWDVRNLLSTVTDWQSRTTTYTYTNGGRLERITYPNGAYIQFTYDAYFRLQTVSNRRPDNSLIVEYTVDSFDELDAPLQVTSTGGITATHPVLSETYTHDNNNRITSAGDSTFTHNNMGELLTRTKSGTTTTFGWNSADLPGRLQSVSATGVSKTFEYDGLGNRIAATRDGVVTRYVLDLSGRLANVLAETDSGNNVKAYYIHGLGLTARVLPDNTALYYHYDRRGNVVALTDDSGNVTDQYAYEADPFGFSMARQGTSDNPFTFVGRYGVMDEGDNLFYMRARYYDAETGRFLSEDPIGFSGGDLNLYAYVGGNPIDSFDPSGLNKISIEELLEEIVKDIGKELSKAGDWKVVHVSGYFNKNGKWVSSYWRRAPNTVKQNAGAIGLLFNPAVTFAEVINDDNLTGSQKMSRLSISIIPFANTVGEGIDICLGLPEDENSYDYIFSSESPVVDKMGDGLLWGLDKFGLKDKFMDWSSKSSWIDFYD